MEAHLKHFCARQVGLAHFVLAQVVHGCEGREPVKWHCWCIKAELARCQWARAALAAR